jgi:hypothetical protein
MPGRFLSRRERRDLTDRCTRERSLRFPRDTAWAAVGLVVVMGVFVALYYLVFTDVPVTTATDGTAPTCGPSEVACRLQANQGVIETFAIFVALVGAFIIIYQRNADHRSLAHQFEYWLVQAVYEAVHNLHHIAGAFDGESLRRAPIYSLRLAHTLASDPLEGYLRQDERGRRLWNHIDHMARNDVLLQRLSLGARPDPSRRPVGRARRRHHPDLHPAAASAEWATAEEATKYLVEHMLRFIADAVADYQELQVACVLWRAAGKAPHAYPLRDLASLLVSNSDTEFYVRFHAKSLAEDEAEAQLLWGGDVALTPLCWLDDRPEQSRNAAPPPLVVGGSFAGLGDPPIAPPARSAA